MTESSSSGAIKLIMKLKMSASLLHLSFAHALQHSWFLLYSVLTSARVSLPISQTSESLQSPRPANTRRSQQTGPADHSSLMEFYHSDCGWWVMVLWALFPMNRNDLLLIFTLHLLPTCRRNPRVETNV